MCEEIREALSEYIDGEASSEMRAKIESHLETCEICRQVYDELLSVTAALRSLPEVEVPAGFEQRIIERIFSAEQRETIRPVAASTNKRFFKRLSSIAAIFVVGIFALTMYNNIDKPDSDIYKTTPQTPSESHRMQQPVSSDIVRNAANEPHANKKSEGVNTSAVAEAESTPNVGEVSLSSNAVSVNNLPSTATYLVTEDADRAKKESATRTSCRGMQKSLTLSREKADSEQALLMNMRCLEKELEGQDYLIKSSKSVGEDIWKFEVIIDSQTVNYLSQDGKIWIETTEESSL